MGRLLRVLLVEDRESDSELLVRELRGGGFEIAGRRVETPDAMRAALEAQPWDLILSDFAMPGFGAPAALALMKQMQLDVPFIIVSGTIGEDAAVESLRAGAADFLVKGKLARLLPAIERELREAATRAERRAASALRESFIAVASHELRTPLTVLLYETWLMGRVGERPVPPRVRQGIARSAARLQRTIEQLTTMLAIEKLPYPLDIAPVSVAQLAREAAEDSQPFIEARRQELHLDVSDEASVLADATKVRDAIDNLLLNAIKFTPDGGRVTLSTHRTAQGGAEIRVADNGDGIDAASLSHLFEPFFAGFQTRLHSSGRFEYRARGLGLGLAIARSFVEMHGGSIEVQSRPGAGTTFTVRLPAEPASEHASHATLRPTGPPRPGTQAGHGERRDG